MSKSEEKERSLIEYIRVLQSKADRCDEFEKVIGKLEDFKEMVQCVWDRTMSVSEISKYIGIDVRTVRGYIKQGLISIHPQSTDGKMLVRVSDVLIIHSSTLRRQISRKNKNLLTSYGDIILNT